MTIPNGSPDLNSFTTDSFESCPNRQSVVDGYCGMVLLETTFLLSILLADLEGAEGEGVMPFLCDQIQT